MSIGLSKSRFLSGSQCEKKLYFDVYRKELKPVVSSAQQQLFDTGHRIGALAQSVFGGGFDATPANIKDYDVWLNNTKDALANGLSTIYEAAFSHDGLFAALDILHHRDGERWAIEVKSSSDIKEYHLIDAAFQFRVMEGCGVRPDRFFIMHIDSKYTLNGVLEPERLLKLIDITDKVIDCRDETSTKLASLKSMLDAKLEPAVSIGTHCGKPFVCEYQHHCWKDVPQDNIFKLPRIDKKKAWELYSLGITHINELTDEHGLSANQQISVSSFKSGASHIDKPAINGFLNNLCYPLSFLDFETIIPSIPILQGTKPFQQLPFQYSLHVIHGTDAEPECYGFLSEEGHFRSNSNIDPLEVLVQSMLHDLPKNGSILAYNMKFEKGIVASLANRFPSYADFLADVSERMVDLLDVFSKGWYHLPEMYYSSSIKVVLPAIAPEFNYDDLEVGNGMDASRGYQRLIDGTFDGDTDKFRNDLIAYCKRDTEGMVVIWRALINVTNIES